MLKLNAKHSLLAISILTALSMVACQTEKVAPKPAPVIAPAAVVVKPVVVKPVVKPVYVPAVIVPAIPEDPLVREIKSIDRSNINARLNLVGKYAGHYPPHFPNKIVRRAVEAEVRDLLRTLNQNVPQSSTQHDQLLQGFKVNAIARNLDIGSNTTKNADGYIRQALNIKPKDPETNFWFGVLLSEGGGMTEGIPYLTKAAQGGYNEAYLSLANAYLGLSKKQKALDEIKKYQNAVPNDSRVPAMIQAIKDDKASIW
jgi:hypothetical protein